MAFKKFTKLTSGALLLSATSALTLQAQVGLGANNSSLNDTASKVFLEKGVDSGKSVPVLKVLGIFVGVVILGVVVCVLVDQRMKRRQLPEKNGSAGVSNPEVKKGQLFGMNPDNIGIDQLIEELEGLKVEDFLKGELSVENAKKRNKDRIKVLAEKITSFGIKDIDSVVKNLGIAVNEAFSENLNLLAHKNDLEKNDAFLEKATPAFKELKQVDAIVYVEDKDKVEITGDEAKLITGILDKYKEAESWSFIVGRNEVWQRNYEYVDGKREAEQVQKIFYELKKSGVVFLFKSFVKDFHSIVEKLKIDIDISTKFEREHRGKFEDAAKKFNENKKKIIESLKKYKETKKQGDFLGLFKSSIQLYAPNNVEVNNI